MDAHAEVGCPDTVGSPLNLDPSLTVTKETVMNYIKVLKFEAPTCPRYVPMKRSLRFSGNDLTETPNVKSLAFIHIERWNTCR